MLIQDARQLGVKLGISGDELQSLLRKARRNEIIGLMILIGLGGGYLILYILSRTIFSGPDGLALLVLSPFFLAVAIIISALPATLIIDQRYPYLDESWGEKIKRYLIITCISILGIGIPYISFIYIGNGGKLPPLP